MAAPAKQSMKEKAPINIVHQNAIWRETVTKEQQNQKLYTEYNYNPFKNPITVAEKPTSISDKSQESGDHIFLDVYKKSQQTPTQKYDSPLTEAQEIGWYHSMQFDKEARQDERLHHPMHFSEITKYMEAAWRQKEQENLQQ